MVRGVQFATMIGTYRMRMWLVRWLVLRVLGQASVADFMDMVGVKRFGWITSIALETKPPWRNVHMADGETTGMYAVITTMLEYIVYQGQS